MKIKSNKNQFGKEVASAAVDQQSGFFSIIKLIVPGIIGALVFTLLIKMSIIKDFKFGATVFVLTVASLLFVPGALIDRVKSILLNKYDFLVFWVFCLVVSAPALQNEPEKVRKFIPFIIFFTLQLIVTKLIIKSDPAFSEFNRSMQLRSSFKSNFITEQKFQNFKVTLLRSFFACVGYIFFVFARIRISLGILYSGLNNLFDEIEYDYSQKPQNGYLVELETDSLNQVDYTRALQSWVPEYIATKFMFLLEDEDPKQTSPFACYSYPIEKIAFESLVFIVFDYILLYYIVYKALNVGV